MQPKLNNPYLPALFRTSAAMSLIAACSLFVNQTNAASVTLTNLGSNANIDLDSGAGMNWWDIDGQNQLQMQWFNYRVGNSGLAQSINSISAANILYTNANTLVASYANAQFTLTISYLLTGGSYGAGSADILETISIQNHSGGTLDFNLFQYSNFDLLGTTLGDTVEFLGLDSVVQKEGVFGIQEGIIQPAANHAEAAYAGPGGTLDKLATIAGYNLNDNLGPISGDVTWAFQWNYQIADGSSLEIFKDKTLIVPVIPEPSALSLIAAGLAALVTFGRRK